MFQDIFSPQGDGDAAPLEKLRDELTLAQGGRNTPAEADLSIFVARAQINAARYMKVSLFIVALTGIVTSIAALGLWLWPHADRYEIAAMSQGPAVFRLDKSTGSIMLCFAPEQQLANAGSVGVGYPLRCSLPTAAERKAGKVDGTIH